MNLEPTDEEGAALANELDGIVRNDRYPLSPRIQTLLISTGPGPHAPSTQVVDIGHEKEALVGSRSAPIGTPFPGKLRC
jgi:hypothetical protein